MQVDLIVSNRLTLSILVSMGGTLSPALKDEEIAKQKMKIH